MPTHLHIFMGVETISNRKKGGSDCTFSFLPYDEIPCCMTHSVEHSGNYNDGLIDYSLFRLYITITLIRINCLSPKK